MKKHLVLYFFISFLGTASLAQIIRPFTVRYNNPSVKGGIVYVANSIVSSAGIGSGVPGTGEMPPTGNTVNGSAGIDIDVDNINTTKLAFGSLWNYHANNAAPPNDGGGNSWKVPAYVLNGPWNVGALPVAGPGKYGYNSGQATCLPSGQAPICSPIPGNKYSAYYFRQTVNFTATELSTTFQNIQINVQRDDGIVIYINGVERARDNMPAGVPVYGTFALVDIPVGVTENVTFNLSPAFFAAGVNTIAVEVHSKNGSPTDISFDMQILGLGNNGTHNSSSADLNLPTCSTVLFAGLYWGSGEGSGAQNTAWITGETTCKLKIPGAASYSTLTSLQTDYWNATLIPGYAHTGFNCFKDITSLINTSSPNGTYTIADVLSPLGKADAYGGWTIVIAYANPSLQPQNLDVYDGNAVVKSGSGNVDVAISGFLTPPTGPVSCELGTIVFDGDRGSSDGFQFKQTGAALFYDMATLIVPLNGAADAWNSKISTKGVVNAARNPAFNNTIGYDASIFDLPNSGNAQLSNNQTGATVRFFSNNENVITNVLTTAVSQYNPTFAFDKSAIDINGGAFVPGDSLLYKITYTNTGNDSSTNSVIIDQIPTGATFIPGSIKINGVTKTDGAGDDEAEFDLINNKVTFRIGVGANAITGGNIGNTVNGNVEFKVVSAGSCVIVGCVGSLKNSAKISYNGKRSGSVLYDSSGVVSGGCIVKGPLIHPLSGSCYNPLDTLLVNRCSSSSLFLPFRKYAGYNIYSSKPFIPANIYDPRIAVTSTHVYWAYYSNGAGCSDTVRIAVIITACPDIDDDNDGIPDYVEFNDPVALQDLNGDGIPNWQDPTYPGFVDNNNDGVNDNFDWGADSNNDGIPNFNDRTFWKGWVDVNGDGVNDLSDKDLDGIPNQYDLDSDNDGIPDVVESYGVDTNGDGIIDNYTDTDNDGFSQNVDGNNTGVGGSGNGLGAPDFDGDGIPNYLDTDSDNDGIPDIIEAGGVDVNNDGMVDSFTDNDANGFDDNITGAAALLKTGPDVGPVDGRADNYPNRNKDFDAKPNPYDMDSDGDGIVDVVEAGFPDADKNGIIDGAIGANGWATVISSRPTLNLRFTDGDIYPDYLDIDSDNDGIPDNIEGQTTNGYILPTLADSDGDGLANVYDNIVGFGGTGIVPVDTDMDGIPDYLDLDTDADGQPDIVEGNDFNRNNVADDNVTLTGLDTDGDGLDNRFDSLNSVINIKGTSYNMGNGGSYIGDATPGARCPVTKKFPANPDRAWRFNGTVLDVQFLQFSGVVNNNEVLLNWVINTSIPTDHFEIERSTNNSTYMDIGTLATNILLNQPQQFSFNDDIINMKSDLIYYRLKIVEKAGNIKYSKILLVRIIPGAKKITLIPNPANDHVEISFYCENETDMNIVLADFSGKTVMVYNQQTKIGYNILKLNDIYRFSNGIYSLQLTYNNTHLSETFIINH